jgi:LmbE family N-acetylglucosaminyl deacetylase
MEVNNMTNNPKRLLCVMAHPDDETLGTGGMLLEKHAKLSCTPLPAFSESKR